MAKKLEFKPAPVDPREELVKQLQAAPREHAEALLLALQTLQTAHDKGVLDLVKGLMGGRDILATEMGKAMKSTEGVNALRNMISLGKMLGGTDPEMLQRLAKDFAETDRELRDEAKQKPPSLWAMGKRVFSQDGRRGISVATRLLMALGRASRS
jgi:uncharacterized protein YjgD (DUF1641 family)